jgi:hypothetical protein
VRRFDYLVRAVKTAGAGKLIFGSDGPWLHPGLELYKIKLLGLPPAAEARITGLNAARLLRMRVPGGPGEMPAIRKRHDRVMAIAARRGDD